MSLRGRLVIDKMKTWTLQNLNMVFPVPPYGAAEFWEKSYKDFTLEDPPQEWGYVAYKNLQEYQYKSLPIKNNLNHMVRNNNNYNSSKISNSNSNRNRNDEEQGENEEIRTTTLVETLGLKEIDQTAIANTNANMNANRSSPNYNPKDDDPILMLGCGNSRMALEMWQSQKYKGPILQVDVSSRIVDVMTQMCAKEIRTGDMMVIQDDATQLSSIGGGDGAVAACVDKGLMDALFCADCFDQCQDILRSVHRVLKPDGIYAFYSFSRPEYVLPKIMPQFNPKHWQPHNLQVRHDVTNQIMLYRFQKASEVTIQLPERQRRGQTAKSRPKRR